MSLDNYILIFILKLSKIYIYITGNKIIILGPKYTNTFIKLRSKFNPSLPSAIPMITPTIPTKYNNDKSIKMVVF